MAKTKAHARKEVGVKGQASRSKEHGTPPVNKNIKKAEQKQAEPRRVDETGGIQRTHSGTGVSYRC